MNLLRKRLRIKVCSGCGGIKVRNNFYQNRYNEDGLDYYCKLCRREYFAEWSAGHRDRRYLIQWRYRNKTKRSLNLPGTSYFNDN